MKKLLVPLIIFAAISTAAIALARQAHKDRLDVRDIPGSAWQGIEFSQIPGSAWHK